MSSAVNIWCSEMQQRQTNIRYKRWRSACFLHHWRGERVCVCVCVCVCVWIIHNPPPVVQQAARRGVCLFNLHAAPCLSVNTQVKLPGDWVFDWQAGSLPAASLMMPGELRCCSTNSLDSAELRNVMIETQRGGVDVIHTVKWKAVQANRAACGRIKWLSGLGVRLAG